MRARPSITDFSTGFLSFYFIDISSIFMMLLKYSCQVAAFPLDDVMFHKRSQTCFLLLSSIKSSENNMTVEAMQDFFPADNFANCCQSVATSAEVLFLNQTL